MKSTLHLSLTLTICFAGCAAEPYMPGPKTPPTCATFTANGYACVHGTCSDADGWPSCDCEPGFGGALCAACDDGLQDNDNNGSCLPTCDTAADVGFACFNGTCSDADGVPGCACNPNYAGDLCDRCSPTAMVNNGACTEAKSTCAELLASNLGAPDGDYTLYVGHDVTKPWTAYCRNMASGTPKEYLTLIVVGTSSNYSQYTAGGSAPGSNVRTNYSRIRINPTDLTVDIGDMTYATSTGSLVHPGSATAVTSMPFGTAMSCDGNLTGLANIDLRGTEFEVAEPFCGSGTSTLTTEKNQVFMTGGGGCGWRSSTLANGDCIFNPFNSTGGFALNLAYRAP